jgi:uncharacterized protein (DUF2235 family)
MTTGLPSASSGWRAAAAGRNIVLCCDGTSNEYCDQNTNVVKLFSILVKDRSRQLCFYDPGLGTFSSAAALTQVAKTVTKVLGLAIGLGVTKNIEDAYEFVMNTWQPGDRIFIFGFSRGAYTARAVAAMLHKVWLLDARSPNLIPYASKMFKYENKKAVWEGFGNAFGQRCPIHFLGLWDTVNSIGWAWDPFILPHTTNNRSVTIVRHAVSIDERRAFFRQHMWGPGKYGEDVKQVWFAGDHCDVGGSHPERESGLSQIALEWMVEQAEAAGLLVDRHLRDTTIPPPGSTKPGKAAAGEPEAPEPPDHMAQVHDSLTAGWWLFEFYPKRFRDPSDNWKDKHRANLFRRRFMGTTPLPRVHESVVLRMGQDPTYRPANVLAVPKYEVEPWPRVLRGPDRQVNVSA